MVDMCYVSPAKEYRNQMGGAPDAASLPAPKDHGIETWQTVAASFKHMVSNIEAAIRLAEAGHEGDASQAASTSIAEIKPYAEAAAETSVGVRSALEQQATYQREAFSSLPAQGDPLPSGKEAILDPPQKGWVEDWGLDSNPITGWMSDYEERQQAFTETSQQATSAMERYSAQTEANIAQMPEFKPADQPPPPQPQGSTPYPSTPSGYSNTPSGYTSGGGISSAPAGTSSSWASAPSPTPSYTPTPTPSTPPAATNPVWANPMPGPGQGLPPGVVRGPDGTLYRQNPQTGAWERQNPYNGRWAPSPNGGPGGARGGMGGAGGMGRGGVGAGGAGQLGAGGRAGAGGLGGGMGSGSGASGSTAAGAGGRGAAGGMGGAGGAGRGKQDEEDQEHERPSWLTEDDDVFTNDMEKVAPPVFGDWSNGGR